MKKIAASYSLATFPVGHPQKPEGGVVEETLTVYDDGTADYKNVTDGQTKTDVSKVDKTTITPVIGDKPK